MSKSNSRTPLPGSESFESLGEVWHLAPLGPRITDAYGQWCRMRARQSIARDRAILSHADYEEEIKLLRRQIAAGEYDWGPPPEMQGTGMGDGCLSLFLTETGKMRLFGLLLEPAHGELDDEEVQAIVRGDSEAASEAFNTVFFSRYPWLRPGEKKASETSETDQATNPQTTTSDLETSLAGAATAL